MDMARKRARDYLHNRRYVQRRKANPITRNADRLIRRAKYLRDKALKAGCTDDIAGLYQYINGEWILMDFYSDWRTAKGSVSQPFGQRWQSRNGECFGYDLSTGLKYHIVVKSAQAFHNALRIDSRNVV